ncbi:hypothetical protein G3A44_03115 [Ideonella sp. TBM-1]|uniref:Uncharacterized protein n=1 Tax=Ideonella livida TaxID=2707176 RepID=A0A7C9TGZ1_9BURK|nr:hypothetical protein [Ideonella livida]
MALAGLGTALPAPAADVGVSVTISQPGVYGRVDIGRFPQPQVVVARPVVVVAPAPRMAPPPPVYMWVPPGHRKHWHKHCHRYEACGVPVYFVQDGWYERHVRPAAAQGPGQAGEPRSLRADEPPRERGQGRGHGEGHGHGEGRGHGDGRGHGEGRGHGKGHD